MKLRTFLAIHFSIFLTLLIVLAVVMLEIWKIQKSLTIAEHRHYESFKLADQLRQSSDDLTRMVRTYTVTGNPSYKDYFHTILAIRDGEHPRPLNYEGIYWDFIIPGENDYAPAGEPVALRSLMEHDGFHS